jgi:uncharacterized damage-inducible protein DinB
LTALQDGASQDLGEVFVEECRRRFADLQRRAASAVAQLRDEDIVWRPNEESNSIANLVIHMEGNMHQRLEAGIGGVPDRRDRDAEFNERQPMTREDALRILSEAFGMTDRVLGELSPARLFDPQWIRGRQVTVFYVLLSTAAHMSEHVGQILYIAKQRLGSAYQVVSIPHRKA